MASSTLSLTISADFTIATSRENPYPEISIGEFPTPKGIFSLDSVLLASGSSFMRAYVTAVASPAGSACAADDGPSAMVTPGVGFETGFTAGSSGEEGPVDVELAQERDAARRDAVRQRECTWEREAGREGGGC